MDRMLALDPSGECSLVNVDTDRMVTGAADALRSLNEGSYELFLLCPGELEISRTSLLRRAMAKDPLMGIILIGDRSGYDRVTLAAVDRVLPPEMEPEELIGEIEEIIATRRLLAECDLVGKSPELKAIGKLIFRVAPTGLPVLIMGESGTGKELVARAIHRHSGRNEKIFLAVNSAAIPRGTLESELFGHERGAFTGASSRHQGYFEQADGGTLFLDEIAEIPPEIQAKLLRVLESGSFMRVGGSSELHSDVRLLGATNANLARAMSEGDFREDLYYRLSAVKVNIPPLRERTQDIPILVTKFLMELEERHSMAFGGLSRNAVDRMMDYHWPGNVRELKNLVENALLLAGEEVVEPEDLEGYFSEHANIGRNLPATVDERTSQGEDGLKTALAMIFSELRALRESMNELEMRVDSLAVSDPGKAERLRILRALRDNDYDKDLAAAELGISLRTLYRRLKKYDIET